MRELLRTVRALPDVVEASLAFNTPFSNSTSNTSMIFRGEQIHMLASRVEPQLASTLRLEVVAGRWLQEDDLAQNWEAVVLTRSLARAFFGLDDPIGRDLPLTDDNGEPGTPQDEGEIQRVVGVVSDYKKSGRFDPAPHAQFRLVDFDDLRRVTCRVAVLVRLQPGTPRAFEQTLVATLRGAAPDWTFEVEVLDDRRVVGAAQQADAAGDRRRRRRVPDPDGGPRPGGRPLPERRAAHVGIGPAPGARGKRRLRTPTGAGRVAGPDHARGRRRRRRLPADAAPGPRGGDPGGGASWKRSSWPPR